MAPQGGIILLEFQFLGLQFLVARGRVARGRLAQFPGFRAFNGDDFAWHGSYSFSFVFSSASSSSLSDSLTPTESTVPSCPSRRCRSAPSFSSCAWACTVNRVQGIASRRARGMGLPVSSHVP